MENGNKEGGTCQGRAQTLGQNIVSGINTPTTSFWPTDSFVSVVEVQDSALHACPSVHLGAGMLRMLLAALLLMDMARAMTRLGGRAKPAVL